MCPANTTSVHHLLLRHTLQAKQLRNSAVPALGLCLVQGMQPTVSPVWPGQSAQQSMRARTHTHTHARDTAHGLQASVPPCLSAKRVNHQQHLLPCLLALTCTSGATGTRYKTNSSALIFILEKDPAHPKNTHDQSRPAAAHNQHTPPDRTEQRQRPQKHSSHASLTQLRTTPATAAPPVNGAAHSTAKQTAKSSGSVGRILPGTPPARSAPHTHMPHASAPTRARPHETAAAGHKNHARRSRLLCGGLARCQCVDLCHAGSSSTQLIQTLLDLCPVLRCCDSNRLFHLHNRALDAVQLGIGRGHTTLNVAGLACGRETKRLNIIVCRQDRTVKGQGQRWSEQCREVLKVAHASILLAALCCSYPSTTLNKPKSPAQEMQLPQQSWRSYPHRGASTQHTLHNAHTYTRTC